MSELFEKSIRVLELPRLLERLERHAVSADAKARARRLTPSDDFGEVSRLLDETDAARESASDTFFTPENVGLPRRAIILRAASVSSSRRFTSPKSSDGVKLRARALASALTA